MYVGTLTWNVKTLAKQLHLTVDETLDYFKDGPAKFSPEEWLDIHGKIQKFQTDVWVWNETNWDD